MAEIKGYNMTMGRALKKEGKSTDGAKNRVMAHVAISKTGNRYVAKGEDKLTGDPMSKILGEKEAMDAIASKHAVKSYTDWED